MANLNLTVMCNGHIVGRYVGTTTTSGHTARAGYSTDEKGGVVLQGELVTPQSAQQYDESRKLWR